MSAEKLLPGEKVSGENLLPVWKMQGEMVWAILSLPLTKWGKCGIMNVKEKI